MINTKVTPKKSRERCPVWFMEVEGKDVRTAHVVKFADSMFVCEKCHVTFKKKEYLAKHMKLKQKHAEIDLAEESKKDIPGPSCSQKDDSDSGSDWADDPKVQLYDTPMDKESPDETSDQMSGHVYRKRTSPSPVQAPRKVVCRTEVCPGNDPGSVTVETHTNTVASGMADKSTQTAVYHENYKSIDNIVEREEFYNI